MTTRSTHRATTQFEYDVCMSFAGEDRHYVRRVADTLRLRGVRVFFDEYAQADMWGKDLYSHLDDIYQNAAKYCVLFASHHYARRVWTNHERESAQARAIREHREYILPARLDATTIPGLRPTVGFVDAAKLTPKRLSAIIEAKLGARQHEKFFPPRPDLLFKYSRVRTARAREALDARARNFFEALRRMHIDERAVVLRVFLNTCVGELPENVHASLDLIRRLTGFAEGKIVRLASGLRSLGVLATVRDSHLHDEYLGEMRTIVLEWHDFYVGKSADTNATATALDVLNAASQSLCEECTYDRLHDLDFCQLASATWRKHSHDRPAKKALQPTSRARKKAKSKRRSAGASRG